MVPSKQKIIIKIPDEEILSQVTLEPEAAIRRNIPRGKKCEITTGNQTKGPKIR
jgi:hypothetical protein